jgi:hypothetical protein
MFLRWVFTVFMSYLNGLTCTFYAAAGMGMLVPRGWPLLLY